MARTTAAAGDGSYSFAGLPVGDYTVQASAPNLVLREPAKVSLRAGMQTLNVLLNVEVEKQQVTIQENAGPTVSTDSANNASAIVLSGTDLDALSDNPDDLIADLQALAGPAAGPNGGQIFIDGISGGELPPKNAIREIRINQNPFSSEYDKLGYGRIEILTKPGTDRLHGQFMVIGTMDAFNSKNPFEGGEAPPSYNSEHYEGNLGGSLSKRISFFTNLERRNLNDLSVVNTPLVDPTTFQVTKFAGAFPNPRTRTEVSQRFDFQLTSNNTLTGRYQYWRNNELGDGIDGFSLPSVAYNSLKTEHTFQMTDTQVLGPRTINETRFQYIHWDLDQYPLNTTPTISVQGAFTTGGNSGGMQLDTQNRYEVQNITYLNFGKHAIKYGGRLRTTAEDYLSTAHFNGKYVFGSRQAPNCTPTPVNSCVITGLQAYLLTLQDLAQNPQNPPFSSNGAGPSYYLLNVSGTGNAAASLTWLDGALFLQDDWRIRPNVTLSTGLRYEIQNELRDHTDFAPRLGIAWGLDGNGSNKAPKTVLRAGYGIFYDRFTSDLVVQQEMQNGVVQQQFLVQNPQFFNPTGAAPVQLTNSQPQVVYESNLTLRSPYIMQTGVSLERQLGKYANLSVTYLNSRGVHQFYTKATPPPPLPLPGFTPAILYQYESGGIFKQNQLIVNTRAQVGGNLSLWGYYTLNYADGNTSGPNYIPSIPCEASTLPACGIAEDYGRASFDVRHRGFFGGTVSMPWGFRLSPFLVAWSGSPFNITTGQDLYGIDSFNARPTVGTCGSPGVISTIYGCFNQTAQPGQVGIPINEETGPDRVTLNLRLSKTFGFGEKKERAPRGGGMSVGAFGRGPHEHHGGWFGGTSDYHYNLTFSVNARNIFNKVNLSDPQGDLSSPVFGESNGLAPRPFSNSTANRMIYLQMLFNF